MNLNLKECRTFPFPSHNSQIVLWPVTTCRPTGAWPIDAEEWGRTACSSSLLESCREFRALKGWPRNGCRPTHQQRGKLIETSPLAPSRSNPVSLSISKSLSFTFLHKPVTTYDSMDRVHAIMLATWPIVKWSIHLLLIQNASLIQF